MLAAFLALGGIPLLRSTTHCGGGWAMTKCVGAVGGNEIGVLVVVIVVESDIN